MALLKVHGVNISSFPKDKTEGTVEIGRLIDALERFYE
jgi:hypothetical protein